MAHRKRAFFGRLTLNSLTILSLLCSFATAALWARSYWECDMLRHHTNEAYRESRSQSNRGELTAFVYRHSAGYTVHWGVANLKLYAAGFPQDSSISIPGFGYGNFVFPGRPEYVRGVWFPHWFAVLLLAILPAVRLRAHLRNRKRNRAGLCPKCGYDLRATPDRCPECGTEVMANGKC